MPNSPPDTLIHSPHARVLVKVPRRCFSFVSTARPRYRALFNVLELGFPCGAVDVGEREADDEDGAAEGVGEVDAFGHFAADDGEEETAAAGGDGVGVLGQDVVVGTGGGFGFSEYRLPFQQAGPDGFCRSAAISLHLPAEDHLVEVGVAGEEDDKAVGDGARELQETASQSLDHGGRVALVVGEVEFDAAWSFGHGDRNEVFLWDYVPAAEGSQASGIHVCEKVADVVIHLRKV